MKAAAVVLLALVAVTARAQDMAGHYYLHGVMEVGSEMLLKPDGNFEWELEYGAADYWAKGTWHRDGDAVVLHSTGKEREPFRFLRSEAGKPGQIRVFVLGKNGKGVDNIDTYLLIGDKPQEGRTDENGLATYPDDPKARAIVLEVRVYEAQSAPFRIDPAKKDYYFEIDGEAMTQVLFKDERLTIDGTSLIMKRDPDHPMKYERGQ
jgi:hypothetical protein